ncbi:PTS sugar transporter subunit IIA [Marinilactibacillus psychrotolerans]|uniref:PTS sugar transporter subunit IIA n=1 Tax=Marinilactibacillus psychrotolerans TaxID=191770 RepID=UPI0038839A1B
MDYAELFREDLIQLNTVFRDRKELFETIYKELLEKELVKNTFLKAVENREENYPTGLQFENLSIAIPHTDVKHIEQPFVYICTLEKPIPFIQMGTSDTLIEAEVILVLGIKEPKEQVGMLSRLMEIFSNKEFIKAFKNTDSESEILVLFKKEMERTVE